MRYLLIHFGGFRFSMPYTWPITEARLTPSRLLTTAVSRDNCTSASKERGSQIAKSESIFLRGKCNQRKKNENDKMVHMKLASFVDVEYYLFSSILLRERVSLKVSTDSPYCSHPASIRATHNQTMRTDTFPVIFCSSFHFFLFSFANYLRHLNLTS